MPSAQAAAHFPNCIEDAGAVRWLDDYGLLPTAPSLSKVRREILNGGMFRVFAHSPTQ